MDSGYGFLLIILLHHRFLNFKRIQLLFLQKIFFSSDKIYLYLALIHARYLAVSSARAVFNVLESLRPAAPSDITVE